MIMFILRKFHTCVSYIVFHCPQLAYYLPAPMSFLLLPYRPLLTSTLLFCLVTPSFNLWSCKFGSVHRNIVGSAFGAQLQTIPIPPPESLYH